MVVMNHDNNSVAYNKQKFCNDYFLNVSDTVF